VAPLAITFIIFCLLDGPRDGARVGFNEWQHSAGWYPHTGTHTLVPTHTTYLNVVAGAQLVTVRNRCSNILDSPAQYSIVLLVEEWVIFADDSLE